jgi:hypothetical protein
MNRGAPDLVFPAHIETTLVTAGMLEKGGF